VLNGVLPFVSTLDAHIDVIAIDYFYSQMANFGKHTEILDKLICGQVQADTGVAHHTNEVEDVATVAARAPSATPIGVCDSATMEMVLRATDLDL
jgi:hypothetical protein